MVGTVLGHYRILEYLDAGGMGVVYRARDERLQRDIAVKLLPSGTLADDAARRRFRREALALSRLNHPNIATVHDFDTQNGVDFLALELVRGEGLDRRVARGPLPEREVIELGIQMARGLEAAHREGVIHRDLKPANLHVTEDGLLKILDFGLARLEQGNTKAPTATALTEEASVLGTLAYMAPEQLLGGPADARTDLFAMGGVLYELATGRRPFDGDSPARLMYQIVNETPGRPSRHGQPVSAGLESIILRALQKDRALRHGSAHEMRQDLERLAATGQPGAPATRPRSRRRSFMYGAAVAGLLVLAAVLGRTGCPGSDPQLLRSLAVLPLANLSGDPAQDFFADGMTEELITTLTKISALTVISHNSVRNFKGTTRPLREIGRALHVPLLVQGSVRRSGGRVRISTQLVRSSNGQNLWADSYENDARDVLRLQSDVALAIAREIEVTLTPQEQRQITSVRPIDSRAHELYLKGRQELTRYQQESSLRGIRLLEESLELDPRHAPSCAALAEAYYSLSNFYWPPAKAMPLVRTFAKRAVELDSTLAAGHIMLALVTAFYDWRFDLANAEITRAVTLNPGDATVRQYAGYILLQLGRLDVAEQHFQRALELDPLSRSLQWLAAFPSFFRGEYDRLAQDLEFRARVEPDNWMTFSLLGETYEQKHDFDRALENLRKSWSLGGNTWVLAAIGRTHAEAGRPDSARAVIRALEALRGTMYVQDYGIATIHAALGDNNRAFELLEQCYRLRSEDLIFIKIDPRTAPLRADPRYRDLLHRIGLS